MTLDPAKWRELPGRKHQYEYIGRPTREPDPQKIKKMIRDALAAALSIIPRNDPKGE